MFLVKEIALITVILISAFLGLFKISDSYLGESSSFHCSQSEAKKNYEQINNQKLSESYYELLHLIQNQSIDYEKIQVRISSLDSEFEKDFLSALIKKREGDYNSSFNLLFTLLKKTPTELYYCEQLVELGRITNNLDKLSQSVKIEKDSSDFFSIYLSALIKETTGKTTEAIDTYKFLIVKGFSSKEIYFQLADALRTVGNYSDAYNYLSKAELKWTKDDPFYPKIINLKGTLFFLSGDFENAKKEYSVSLELSRKTKNTVEEIKATANLALIKDQYGEVIEARADLLNAIRIAEEIENAELLASLYSELGVSYTYTYNLVEARNNYEKSYSLNQLLRNNERLSYLSANIGSLFLQVSNYKSAIDYYDDGLKYAGDNKLGQILNLTGIADVYSNESNYSKAIEYYYRAKELADSINDVSSGIKINEGIGALYYNINRPNLSLETLKKIESTEDISNFPYELIKVYSNIGTVLTSMNDFKQSENYFLKGLTLAENAGDIYSAILLKTELGFNYFRQEKLKEAEKILFEARQSSREYDLKQVVSLQDLYLGKIYEQKNELSRSVSKFKNSYQLSKETNDHNTQIESGYCLAKYFEDSGDDLESEKWYNETIGLIESISFPLTLNQEIQIAHYSGFSEIYNSFTDFYLKQEKYSEAFLLLEKSKARNTRINLNKLKLLSNLKKDSDVDKFIDLQWMISSGLYENEVLDSLSQLYSALKIKLSETNKSVNEILNPEISPGLQDLKKYLDNDEYYISIYAGEKSIILFNLSPEGFNTKILSIGRDSLQSLISMISPIYKTGMESEEIYINEDLFSFNAFAAYNFYKIVFEDFFSSIPENSIIILSSPSELVKLPIELLVTEWNEDESPYYYNDKKFLLSKYQFVYTPSASIYLTQKNKSSLENEQNLLIGNPEVGNTELTLAVRTGLIDSNPSNPRNIKLFPLEYSEEEIKSIEETIDENIVYLYDEATESNFKEKAPVSKIVHISSHSFLVKDQPMVMFTSNKDNREDGLLELGEIVQLGLNSEMVVLSSCRSGLGRVDAAEGIIGMQKAFFEAGSKSVIVSLWDVNDKYTSYFMKEFYKQLSMGKSKAAALRETKIEFIKNYSANPYYWSSFILSGNPSAISLQETSPFKFIYLFWILFLIGVVYLSIKKIMTMNR